MCCKRHFDEYLMVKWKQCLAVSDRTQHLKQRTSLNYVPYVHCFFTTVTKSDQFYLKHPFTADFAALVPTTSGTLSGSQLRHRKYVSAFSVFSHSSQAQKQATSAAGRRPSGTLLISMPLVPFLLFYFLLISPLFLMQVPSSCFLVWKQILLLQRGDLVSLKMVITRISNTADAQCFLSAHSHVWSSVRSRIMISTSCFNNLLWHLTSQNKSVKRSYSSFINVHHYTKQKKLFTICEISVSHNINTIRQHMHKHRKAQILNCV